MRERSLQTVDADRGAPQPTPADVGLPAAPMADSGLEPTESVTRRVDAGPVTALRYQEFTDIPLTHVATATTGETGPRVIATLTNESSESWAYRVPRGPAPLAGGRARDDGDELRLVPEEEPAPVTDGVLRPGESVRSTVSVSALAGADTGWPEGEYSFSQPITVWTDDDACSYHWGVTLLV